MTRALLCSGLELGVILSWVHHGAVFVDPGLLLYLSSGACSSQRLGVNDVLVWYKIWLLDLRLQNS